MVFSWKRPFLGDLLSAKAQAITPIGSEEDGTTMAATYHRFALPYLRTNHMAMPMEEVRPSEEHRRRWMPQGNLRASRPDYGSTAAAVQQLQVSDPLYFNSLVDKSTLKHLTKPTVRKHLYQRGFMARDGAAHQTRQEQVITNRHSRFRTDQESLLVKVEAREQARLQRLRKAARAGDITFTQDGIFETKPCYACKVQHKVASISSPIEPCPGSRLKKYNLPKRLDPLPEPYRTRRSRKVSIELFCDSVCCEVQNKCLNSKMAKITVIVNNIIISPYEFP